MPIDCFDKIMPNLSVSFNKRTEGMTEAEQRAEGIKMVIEEHKKLHDELQAFRKKVGKSTIKKYVAPKNYTNEESSNTGAKNNEVTGGTTEKNNNQAAPAKNNEPTPPDVPDVPLVFPFVPFPLVPVDDCWPATPSVAGRTVFVVVLSVAFSWFLLN